MSLSYDAMVDGLVRLGVPRERAQVEARRQLGVVFPTEQEEQRTAALEKEEQAAIRKLFIAFGFRVYNLSQARASKQTPGLGDMWIVHRTLPLAFWWETKRQTGGRHSAPQVEFQAECQRCGVGYGTGDRFAAQDHLVALGVAVRCGKHLEPAACLDSPLPTPPDRATFSAP